MELTPHSPQLTAAADLAPGLRSRAAEIEEARRLPEDVLKDLTAAGILRMLVPERLGGPGGTLPDALRVIETLARADASTGWTVGQITLAQLIFACFPAPAAELVYRDGPDVLGAGAVAPKGRATAAGDGWRITGQWPYVTGCWYSSWTYLTCVVVDGRAVRVGPDGRPETCMVLVPTSDLEIIDTWKVLGLRGTASHDVRAAGLPCAAEHSLVLAGDDPATAAVRFRIAQAGLLIAAVNVGLAAGALDDVVALAADGKRPAFSRQRLADSPSFQERLGEAYTTCSAARALLYAEAAAAAERSTPGLPAPGPLERATMRATVARVAALTAGVVDTAHSLAGGSSVYQASPLERRIRDAHTASQHFVNGRDHFGLLGALLAGAEVDASVV